jgi:heme-degrading monooxygenase HmoA
MSKIGQPYTSGRWLVRVGHEDEFITRWTEFTQWALENSPGAESFALIREEAEPRRFLSFGSWEDKGSVDAWRNTPEFAERMARCRELCEEFAPSDSVLAAAVGM